MHTESDAQGSSGPGDTVAQPVGGVDSPQPAAPVAAGSGGPALEASPDPGSLEALEADIAAVASALETLEEVLADAGADGNSLRSAADTIGRVVSPERFGGQ